MALLELWNFLKKTMAIDIMQLCHIIISKYEHPSLKKNHVADVITAGVNARDKKNICTVDPRLSVPLGLGCVQTENFR